MNNSVYIIGTGKVGTAFSFELSDAGFKVNFLTGRNLTDKNNIAEKIHPLEYSVRPEKKFFEAADIIFICVQDKFLKDLTREISELNMDLSGKYFIHTSGSESTDVFNYNCFDKDKCVSMHPIQTFDKISYSNTHLLENIYFGIEGGKPSVNIAVNIIEKFNSKYIEIPKDKKHLYHSACVVSSNFLITLLNISSEILGSIGIEKRKTFEIFKPIIEKTLSNVSENGLINSLTGPFERNELETISNHLNSINKEIPSLIPFYTLLGMETVKVAFKKESLNMKNVISLLDLMNEYIVNESGNIKNTIN